MLFEDAYEQAVPASALPVGEYVLVTTKMGAEVAHGVITRVYGNGAVQVRTSDIPDKIPPGGFQSNGDPIYNSSLYMFVPIEELPEPREEDNTVSEAGASGFPGDAPEYKALEKAAADDSAAEKADQAVADKLKGQGAVQTKASTGRHDARSAKAKVDVARLPPDLRQKVQGIDSLDEAQMDRVMSAISDSALKALKDVGVPDAEVYERVVTIQKAVRSKLDK